MTLHSPYLEKQGYYYPIIELSLKGPSKMRRTTALVDSGATFSLFRSDFAELLGIKIETGEKLFLEGVGGRIVGYKHRVAAEVGNHKFKLITVFSPELKTSLSLLGRDNFFQQFRVTFDEKKRETLLRDY